MGEIFTIFWSERALQAFVQGVPIAVLLIQVVICLGILSKGADWMVDGVVHLAKRTGLSRVVIGATVVSLGTTAPEAFVSVMAAWMGNPGLALGNGVGSIIADTGLIFGSMCMISTIPINRYILNRTGWVQVGVATILVAASVVLFFLSDGNPVIPRGLGFLFLAMLVGYMWLTYRWAKQGALMTASDGVEEEAPETVGLDQCWVMILGGLFLVIVGARILVPSAAEIAARIGVPEDVIAATMVAFGTSLPELITAVASVRRGHPEIMVGNIIGADVLNCLFVIGAAAAVVPLRIPMSFFYFHFPAMLLILYCFRIFIRFSGQGRFYRWQGGVLLGLYVLYVLSQYMLDLGSVHG